MRGLIAFIVIIAIAALILIPQMLFTVDETQVAIVTRFGAFQRDYKSPGLYVKQPFVESVVKMDSRLLRVDAQPASLLTSDKRNLVIDAYARYRIIDPLVFFQRLRTELGANTRVADIVNSQLRREVALDTQSEVISETREAVMRRVAEASNRSEITRDEALQMSNGNLRDPRITILVVPPPVEGVQGRAAPATNEQISYLEREPFPPELEGRTATYFRPLSDELGIEIVDVRIKRADFPTDIETSVFARMEAERARIAEGLRAEGNQRDREIRAAVDRDVQIILETANGTAARLRGEAEEEAIRILAEALEQDPEFYEFRRSLEAYENIVDDDTLLVLESDSALFKYLQDALGEDFEVPEMEHTEMSDDEEASAATDEDSEADEEEEEEEE